MTTASPTDQLLLLDVQALDSTIDRIDHRMRTLPEIEQIAAAGVELAELADLLVAASTEIGDLERAVRKAEDEVESVRARAMRDEELLISGTITSPKQLEELQHEVASLARRRTDLEDAELEVMELLESAVANRDQLSARRDALEAQRAAAAERLEVAQGEGARERAAAAAEREALAAGLSADLLRLYEKVRADHGGVGAARVHRGRCEGCHLDLPPQDLARIRSAGPDEVLRCEECRRILVRTAESGL